MKSPLFYKKQPLFGLDVGLQSVKVMQLQRRSDYASVTGFGFVHSDVDLTKKGVIHDPVSTAKLIDTLLLEKLSGRLTTNRVAMGIPTAYVFTRVLTIPILSKRELAAAVQMDVDQAIPLPSKELYYDYEAELDKEAKSLQVRILAAPKAVVDSYVAICDMLNLNLTLVQTNIQADARLCLNYEDLEEGTSHVLVDIGSGNVDIGIVDHALKVTGTVDTGGHDLTLTIAKALDVPEDKAREIKSSQGIGAGQNQKKIVEAVEPTLSRVAAEVKRITRFYEDREAGAKVSQVLITGGGANMPGISEYLTNAIRKPTRLVAPWGHGVRFGKLEPPEYAALPQYLTAAGLALADESEVFSV